ncbi:MAG: GDSL-type esterase/lipase family protein, partial [Brevundimonas sp.]
MIGALALTATLALAAGTAAQERPWTPLPDPVSATCPAGLCQPEGLNGFFAAVERGGPVQIVQFGDSHTAGGQITGSLLWRLQSRWPRLDVRMDAYGVVGETLRGLQARTPLFVGSAPDLVIIAYGTNEGFDDLLDSSAYERLLREQIRRVRQAAPSASILIVGAPEAMRA